MLPACARLGLYNTARQLRCALQCRSFAEQSCSSEAQRTALVQGASRGLGLEFVKQLLERPNQRYMTAWCPLMCACRLPKALRLPASLCVANSGRMVRCRVVATCRNPDGATELQQLQCSSSGRLDLVQLDCTDEASIADAAALVSARNSHLDLLLNVAGILHIPGKMSPGRPS